jgi:hypothetical protein
MNGLSKKSIPPWTNQRPQFQESIKLHQQPQEATRLDWSDESCTENHQSLSNDVEPNI